MPESPSSTPFSAASHPVSPFLALVAPVTLLALLSLSTFSARSRDNKGLEARADEWGAAAGGVGGAEEEGEPGKLEGERTEEVLPFNGLAWALDGMRVVVGSGLLMLSVAKLLVGDGGDPWSTVFDSGLLLCAIYLVISALATVALAGARSAVRLQHAVISPTLLLATAIPNVLPFVSDNPPPVTTFQTLGIAQVGLCGLLVGLLLSTPPHWSPKLAGASPNPSQTASPISRLLFLFLDRPMLRYYLDPTARPYPSLVPPLPDILNTVYVASKHRWNSGSGGLLRFLRIYKLELAKIFAFATLWILGVFAAPLSMNLLLRYVQDHTSTTVSPFLFAVGIFLSPLLASVAYQNALFRVAQLGLRLRASLGQAVYAKLLRTREGGGGSKDGAGIGGGGEAVGRVNNLVGTDIDTITASLETSLQLFGVPPKLIISLIFLYLLLGWSAFVALFTIMAFAPLSVKVSKSYGKVQEEIMKATDRRVTLMGEVLSSIRIIKMFAWEKATLAKISARRQVELDRIKRRAKVFAGMMLLSTGVPTCVTLTTFAAYIFAMKRQLTSSTAFTSLALFSLLREAVISSTYLLSAFMRARVSLDRINSFLADTEEIDESFSEDSTSENIEIKAAEFQWSRYDSNGFVLEIDDLVFPAGKLTLVAGDVGSGKSALLYALLGEMHLKAGSVRFPAEASTSYAAQSAWLQDQSVRENILFGEPYDEDRYCQVLFQCALESDLEILPDGDLTSVGEKGLSLSGGQKQRIALARAVYSRSKIVLLDDVLSAVDSNTVSHLVEHCLNGELLQGRTVVLVTHFVDLCVQRLEECELVVTLADGRIQRHSHPALLSPEAPRMRRSGSSTSQRSKASSLSNEKAGGPAKGDEDDELKVSWAVYRQYFAAMGGSLFWISYAVVNLVAHVFMQSQGFWVGRWVNAADRDTRAAFYFGCYGGIQLATAVSLTAMYLALIFGALQASRKLHSRLATSIFSAPLRFFDSTPMGNIIARFSKDTETVDTEIVETTQPVFDYSVQVLFVAIIISIILPVFLFPALAIAFGFYLIGRIYIRNALSARKHVAGARSPLFSTLGDTTSGAVTIRAFSRQRDFASTYRTQTDTYNKYQLHELSLNRWLEERSDFVGAMVSFIVALLALRAGISSGTTGFLISTGLEFTSRILFVVRAINKNELSLNSAHRILQYSKIEQEAQPTKRLEPPASWPHAGEITFTNYSARYTADSADILRGISFTIMAGERIGIVGASGCGKSSLALSILRFLTQSSGSISIDGLDLEQVNLEALRSRITLIPQDPTLFAGDLRSNLDPNDECDDADLWIALQRSKFSGEGAEGSRGANGLSLDTQVQSSGANFSQGQRQLLSLARAMVRRSKIIILDEATASLDNVTDRVVQDVIRREFSSATMLTIAHRLESIMDFDRVLVLHQGEIAELETPSALLDRPNGVFRGMVEATGNWEKLSGLAKKKKEQ